jgi:hypothetical protein
LRASWLVLALLWPPPFGDLRQTGYSGSPPRRPADEQRPACADTGGWLQLSLVKVGELAERLPIARPGQVNQLRRHGDIVAYPGLPDAPTSVRWRCLRVATSQHRRKDIQMHTYLFVYRHPENYITLAMLALAFVMACAAAASPAPPADPWHYARHGGPIALTAAEIRRLFTSLAITAPQARLTTRLRAISDIQHWSSWRRLHQGQARHSHYQHRLTTELGP